MHAVRPFSLCLVTVLLTWLQTNTARAVVVIEDDVLGDWVQAGDASVIRVYRCGEAICGRIVKLADPTRLDVQNPDPILRERPLVGVVIGKSFGKRGPTTWSGKLYNLLDGRTYEGTLNMLDKNRFTIVGCLANNLVCDARTFYRTNGGLPESDPFDQKLNVASPPIPIRKLPLALSDRPIPQFDTVVETVAETQSSGEGGRDSRNRRANIFQRLAGWWRHREQRWRQRPLEAASHPATR